MKYLFLLGRNAELSIAEIFSYFEKEEIQIKLESTKTNGILIDSPEKLDLKKIITQLGGTIAAGEVLFDGNPKQISKYILENQIYTGTTNKPAYSIFNFADEETSEIIAAQIKSNFKQEKLKAKYLPLKGFITTQKGKTIFGSPSKIKKVDKRYFLFKGDNSYFFGNLSEVFDSKESEKRDMEKPARRESLAISPRLAKILINLSSVKEGGLLLDPFCGIGVILQEALLNKINVVGVDLDGEATRNCKTNLNWLRENYDITHNSQVFKGDSERFEFSKKMDGVATEPSLGEVLKKIPQKNKALKMMRKFENLMIHVLINTKKYLNPNSKIAFTAPYIKVDKKRMPCDMDRISDETGLKIYQPKNKEITFPIKEFRSDHIVGREIYVLTN